MVFHGYPWLWVRHSEIERYRRGLVALRRQGVGDVFVASLIESVKEPRARKEAA
jgi:hypothetical protein